MTIRAYPALYLSGTPTLETGTRPPSCLFLENHLYMQSVKIFQQSKLVYDEINLLNLNMGTPYTQL